MKTLAIAIVILVHDAGGWTYPFNCCGMQHCKPVSCDEIFEDRNGLWHWDKYMFHPIQVQPSQDRFCHACIIGSNGACLFTQQGS